MPMYRVHCLIYTSYHHNKINQFCLAYEGGVVEIKMSISTTFFLFLCDPTQNILYSTICLVVENYFV
jgi:hypothetical protein